MAQSVGRISEPAFKVISSCTLSLPNVADVPQVIIGVFFGVAILAAISRVVIRLWFNKKLRLDDYFLISSCVFLAGATGVLCYGISTIFLGAKLAFDPSEVLAGNVNEADILAQANLITKINWSYLALSWVAIFLVKFGFLSLFRHLVDRLPSMYKFWKGALVFTGVVFAFAVCDGFIACPKSGAEAGKKPDFTRPTRAR